MADVPTANPDQLSDAGRDFLRERHLATFTSLRADGTPHVTPVGFTWDESRLLARVITSGTSRKARHAAAGGPVVLCQVAGRRWLALEGTARVASDRRVRCGRRRQVLHSVPGPSGEPGACGDRGDGVSA